MKQRPIRMSDKLALDLAIHKLVQNTGFANEVKQSNTDF